MPLASEARSRGVLLIRGMIARSVLLLAGGEDYDYAAAGNGERTMRPASSLESTSDRP